MIFDLKCHIFLGLLIIFLIVLYVSHRLIIEQEKIENEEREMEGGEISREEKNEKKGGNKEKRGE